MNGNNGPTDQLAVRRHLKKKKNHKCQHWQRKKSISWDHEYYCNNNNNTNDNNKNTKV